MVLANRYSSEKGVDINYEKAVMYWTEASDRGDPEARFCLASCIRDGTGIQQDVVKAFEMMLPLAHSYQHPLAYVN